MEPVVNPSQLNQEAVAKLALLKNILRKMDSVLVAFSGGVDSTFLLKVTSDVLGEKVTALTAVSGSLARSDKEETIAFAQRIGVKHLLVESHEIENPHYVKNPTNRCYFCKSELYKLCQEKMAELNIPWVADGFTVDDQSDYRPGFKAKEEYAVRSPLIEAGFLKEEIRLLSKSLSLPTWDKPASPCLASRIPYGLAVTPTILEKIDRLESFLQKRGLKNIRVRYHEKMVRLELSPADFDKVVESGLRTEWIHLCKEEGFEYVTLDLEGFRSGRLNEAAGIRRSSH